MTDKWETLYKAAFPIVYRALAATLMDGDLARDCLHDAFLVGLRHPPQHDDNLEGWRGSSRLACGGGRTESMNSRHCGQSVRAPLA
jgi:hypothetical protein